MYISRSPAALRDLSRFAPGDFAARVRAGDGGGGGRGVLGTLMPRSDRERIDAPRIDESCDVSRDTLFAGGAAEGRAGALLGAAGAAEGRAAALLGAAGAAEGRGGALLGCAGAADGRGGTGAMLGLAPTLRARGGAGGGGGGGGSAGMPGVAGELARIMEAPGGGGGGGCPPLVTVTACVEG